MKKELSSNSTTVTESDMRPAYDFTGGVRGKHYKARLQGYTIEIHKRDGTTLVRHIKREGVITLEPDVQEYFPTAKAVNHALRTLISLVPQKRKVAARRSRDARQGRRPVAKGRARSL
jgi:hypothetical protein